MKKAPNIKIILSFFCLFLGNITYTEVPFTWMKGVYGVTKLAYSHLSPINGMVWAEQRIVENMYRYGNPDDATIKLIKELFYLQADNVSFRPTILKSKPASYYTPQMVGTIMRVVTEYRENKAEENKKDAQLTAALEQIMQPQRAAMVKEKEILTTQLNTRGATIKKIIEDIATDNKKLDALIRQAKRVSPTTSEQERAAKLKELEEKRKKLTNTRAPLEEELGKLTHESKAIDRALQTGIAQLISYFIQSIKESAPDATQTYVSYATEQILLALLWKIANPRDGNVPKQAFVDYFNELGAMINDNNLKAWIVAKPYNKQDYEQFQKQQFTMITAYEQIILAVKGHSVWESPVPQIITGAQATYVHPGGKQTTQFSDCVETSFRNWFNIVLYDGITSTFNIQRLIDAAQQNTDSIPLRISKNLIDFYHKNPGITNLQASGLYNAWTQVVEDLSDVIYVEPTMLSQKDRFYNIKSSLPNMLKICNHLLFGNSGEFDQLSKKEQLDLMCKKLSRDDFSLTWELIEPNAEKDALAQVDYATLKFIINETIEFEWHLNKGHGVIPPLKNMQYPNTELIKKALMPSVYRKGKLNTKLYTLMALFAPNEKTTNINFIFLQSLDESNEKINIINQLSEGALNNIRLQAVLKQLMKSLIQSEFDDDSGNNAADLILNNVQNSSSPLHAIAQETFKNMKNDIVNEFLVKNIIDNKISDLYDPAKKKFESITDDYSSANVISSVITNKFETWYDVSKKKFESMTDELFISQVINTVIHNRLEAWYDTAKQKCETMADNFELSYIIQAVIAQRLSSWYDVARQKFETMTEDNEPQIVWIDEDVPIERYPLVFVINEIITAISGTERHDSFNAWNNNDLTKKSVNEFKPWDYLARKKFGAMKNKKALSMIIEHVIESKCFPWYDIAFKKAKEIGADDLVQQF